MDINNTITLDEMAHALGLKRLDGESDGELKNRVRKEAASELLTRSYAEVLAERRPAVEVVVQQNSRPIGDIMDFLSTRQGPWR